MKTSGAYENENLESLIDRTMAEGQASSFDLGLPPLDGPTAEPGEEDTDQDLDDDDGAHDGASVRTRERVPAKSEVQRESALEAWIVSFFAALLSLSAQKNGFEQGFP